MTNLEPVDVEGGIRAALKSADRNLSLEVRRMQTVGHLRQTARDIAGNLFGIRTETAEVVALQNAFEKVLNSYCEAMRDPANAVDYVAPDMVRAQQTAQSLAAKGVPAPASDDEPLFKAD